MTTTSKKTTNKALAVEPSGGGETLLDNIISLKIADIVNITPVERTKNIIYLCKVKDGKTTEKYIKITNKADLTTYTDDAGAGVLFDNGMNAIYLAFADNAPDYGELSKYAYTLIIGSGVDATSIDFTSFSGVVVYSTPAVTEEFNTIAITPKRAVVISKDDEYLACAIFASFVSLNNFNDMQYKEFPNYTPVVTNIGDVNNARDNGYTFISQDATTIKIPSLMYFRAGNLPIASIYITENLKQDIQIACYDAIANNNLDYNDVDIATLITVGEKVIANYVNFKLIQGAEFNIPPKEEQKEQDIIVGMLSNVKTNVVLNASIWRLTGDIKTSY